MLSIQDYGDVLDIDKQLTTLDWSPFENKTVLLTGANGMLGMCLANLLLRAHSQKLVQFKKLYFASRNWQSSQLGLPVDSRVKAISNFEISKINPEVDVLIHTASPSNITKIQNLRETISVNSLEEFSFHRVETVIYISSGEVYLGKSTKVEPKESDFQLVSPRDIYPYSKFISEKKFSESSSAFGFNLKIVRLFHSFGPGLKEEDGRSFADFIWRAARSQKIVLHSSGDQIRTFLYILDASLGILFCSTVANLPQVVNLGSDKPASILDFAKQVARQGGVDIEFDRTVGSILGSPFEQIVPNLESIMNLGWSENYGVEFAIDRTLGWARSNLRN